MNDFIDSLNLEFLPKFIDEKSYNGPRSQGDSISFPEKYFLDKDVLALDKLL